MKRHGDLNLESVIRGLIAVFVIAAVILFIANNGNPRFQTFFQSIPGFGQEAIITGQTEALRYDITKDSLSYYTGSAFVSMAAGSHIRLNDKYIESDVVRQAISDYYFNLEARLFYASLNQIVAAKKPTYRFGVLADESDPASTYVTAHVTSFSSAHQGYVESAELRERLKSAIGDQFNAYNVAELKKQVPRRGDIIVALTVYEEVRSSDEQVAQSGVMVVRQVQPVVGTALIRADNSIIFVPQVREGHPIAVLTNKQKAELLEQVVQWRDSILKGGSFETTLDVPFKENSSSGNFTRVTVQPERLSEDGSLLLRLDRLVSPRNAAADYVQEYQNQQEADALPSYDFVRYSLKSISDRFFVLYYSGSDTQLFFRKILGLSSRYQYSLYFVHNVSLYRSDPGSFFVDGTYNSPSYSKIIGDVQKDVIYRDALIPLYPLSAPFTKEAFGHMAALQGKNFSLIPVESV